MSERIWDVGIGFVRARECPDCFHTKCGESCVCNCDAARAEDEAAHLRGTAERLFAALVATEWMRQWERERCAAEMEGCVEALDEFAETVERPDGTRRYRTDNAAKQVEHAVMALRGTLLARADRDRKPWHRAPTCPRCALPCSVVPSPDRAYGPDHYERELMCAACGHHYSASPEDYEAARTADAAWRREEQRENAESRRRLHEEHERERYERAPKFRP